MKIISWNINGIRAVFKKNFLAWFKNSQADILCLQEIKAQARDIPEKLQKLPKYHHSYYNFAQKKGYSGTAIFTKIKPLAIYNKIGFKKFDKEGRFLRLDFKNFILINIYLPQGDRTQKNIPYKLKAYGLFIKYLKKLLAKPIIIIGDFNIAHTEIDLARPKDNQKNTMFTPAEKKQLSKIINLGFIDTFRYFNKKGGHYTWWPYYYNARQKNIGWRLDYCFISKNYFKKLKRAFILNKVPGSDHCPIGINIT